MGVSAHGVGRSAGRRSGEGAGRWRGRRGRGWWALGEESGPGGKGEGRDEGGEGERGRRAGWGRGGEGRRRGGARRRCSRQPGPRVDGRAPQSWVSRRLPPGGAPKPPVGLGPQEQAARLSGAGLVPAAGRRPRPGDGSRVPPARRTAGRLRGRLPRPAVPTSGGTPERRVRRSCRGWPAGAGVVLRRCARGPERRAAGNGTCARPGPCSRGLLWAPSSPRPCACFRVAPTPWAHLPCTGQGPDAPAAERVQQDQAFPGATSSRESPALQVLSRTPSLSSSHGCRSLLVIPNFLSHEGSTPLAGLRSTGSLASG